MKKYILLSFLIITFFSAHYVCAGTSAESSGIKSIAVDGVKIDNLSEDKTYYLSFLPYTTTSNPNIEVETMESGATYTITPPSDLNGTKEERSCYIKIVSPDQATSKVYEVEFKILPKLDIFLALGQSNMAGRGYLTEEDMQPIDDVYLLTPEGNMEIASNPMNKYSSVRKDLSLQQMSPSYSFSKKIRDEAGVSVGIMQNARGGTRIESWLKNSPDGLYEKALERAIEVKRFGEIKGIIWHQGEGNASDPAGYKPMLQQMVNDFRIDLGIPDLYFVAGQIAQWRSAAFNSMITTIPTFVPNSDWVSSAGLTPLIDESDPHFDNKSGQILGERYAQKVLKHIYKISSNKYTENDVQQLKMDIESGVFDTYELVTSGGNYCFSSTAIGAIIPAKSFVLKAAPNLDKKPIISFNRKSNSLTLTTFMPNKENITMHFEGLELDGRNPDYSSPILIRTAKTDATTASNCTIVFKNCFIHDQLNSTSGVIRIDHKGAVVDIQETVFSNCTGSVISYLASGLSHGDLNLKNNTFANISDVASIIYYHGTTTGENVYIDHCTFDNFTSSKNAFVFGDIKGDFNISRSVFSNINGDLSFNTSSPTINYCYLNGFSKVPTGNITNSFDGESPIFADAGNLDFKLQNKSAFICDDKLPAGNTIYYSDPSSIEHNNATSSLFSLSGRTITLNNTGSVKLHNLQGMVVFKKHNIQEAVINIPSGLYILSVFTDLGQQVSQKIILN